MIAVRVFFSRRLLCPVDRFAGRNGTGKDVSSPPHYPFFLLQAPFFAGAGRARRGFEKKIDVFAVRAFLQDAFLIESGIAPDDGPLIRRLFVDRTIAW